MPKFAWIPIVVVAFLLLTTLFVFNRKRRRRKRFVRGTRKHPTGFLKYHDDTETTLRLAIEPPAKDAPEAKAVAVLDFDGDLRASGRHDLSRIVDEVLLNREAFDEVVVRVESPGGSVTDYGHVYGEMCRIPQAGLKLSVCVDAVAASGGYLLSLPATQILAAPFAMVGSIGVVSFVPNLRGLLEKLHIEPRTFTAGDFKRTVTLTDNATPEEVERYREQLRLIHDQFKQALKRHRPGVDLARVATGEAWLAATTVEMGLGLVDRLMVSSDYLLELNRTRDLCFVEVKRKKSALERLRGLAAGAARGALNELSAIR